MKAWVIPVLGRPWEIEVSDDAGVLSDVGRRFFENETLDLTRVMFRGALRHMAVDDNGHLKGLPPNLTATRAYREACKPGTPHFIVGPAVIFEGLLP